MTDRINTITVGLDRDIRDDDCEAILNAIRMIKGVMAVEPNVADESAWLAESRVKREIRQKLFDALER